MGQAAAWPIRFYGSTIGRKAVMAVTGVVLIGFLVIHMGGNLLIHRGPAAINDYAVFLKSNVAVLWGSRTVLLLATLLHVHSALTLSARARAARPVGYAQARPRAASRAARAMRVGGLLLALFIVGHILHFTTGQILPSRFVEGEVYQNVVRSFRSPGVVVAYVVAMVALGLHLRHGIWSAFQTLGASHPNLERSRIGLAWLVAMVLTAGFLSVPLAVAAGWVR